MLKQIILSGRNPFYPILSLCFLLWALPSIGSAQDIKSIHFHLYTDSLKTGVANYINVDALLSSNKWIPLDTTSLNFYSSAGRWAGNDLYLNAGFAHDSVAVTAVLKSDPLKKDSVVIYIKKIKDPTVLPSAADILNPNPTRRW